MLDMNFINALGSIMAIEILERLEELNRPYSHGNLVDKGKTLPESPQAPYQKRS